MSSQVYNQCLTNNILLRVLEHMSHIKLFAKYSSNNYTYENIIINKIIYNQPCSALSKYRDFILLNLKKEFLHRFYYKNEVKLRLSKICTFYERYSRIFPNYIILYERKYVYKNIRKKQKRIDAVNKMKYEKNMIKEYLKDNNCFDNEVFKGPLFTEEVEYEIEKDNMTNNSNYNNNQNENDDTLFTQNSVSLYFKNENCNQYKNSTRNRNSKQKELNIKPGISVESFITNNESNRSIYNIMDLLNDNKIYVNDLRLLLNNNENINTNNINNRNNLIKIGNKYKKYEGIKQILIKENICNNNKIINTNNPVPNNNESNGKCEETLNRNKISNNNIIKKFNSKQFSVISAVSGKMKKTKKVIKNENICNDNNKEDNNNRDKTNNNNSKKIISENQDNRKDSKDHVTSNKNLKDFKDYCHLQTISGIDNNNNNQFLLTKVNRNFKQTEKRLSNVSIKNQSKTKDRKEDNSLMKKKLSLNKLNAAKKYMRYKHISQDLCQNYNTSKDKEDSLRNHYSLANNLDKTNPKLRQKGMNLKSNIVVHSVVKSDKNINNIKKSKKPQIINNQIIIQNNNNYFLTENNNPNLITGTNKNNYDTDDCDTEREKLLIYLKDIAESQRTTRYTRASINQEKSKDICDIIENIKTENDAIRRSDLNINNSQKIKRIKNGDFLKNFMTKQKTEKKFKKNYKYYFNHLNNNGKIANINNYPIIKYNTIRKMNCYKRNNSNLTEKKVDSINSLSKIKKYNSNFSIKTEDLISPNKDTIIATKTISCYSYNDYKNKYKNELISKNKTIKNFNSNRKFLKVVDMISSDSSRNILSQRLRKSKQREFAISLTKDESKSRSNTKSKLLTFDRNSIKNLTISCFNRDNNESKNKKNKIESYISKKENSDMTLKNNKFSSCDFDILKNSYTNTFSKGLLDRINSIKNKINEGIYKKKNSQMNKLKKENTQKIYLNKMNKHYYNIYDKKLIRYNESKEKKNNNKLKRIYENKILNNDNKENIPPQCFIKVNKTKYFGNINSQIYINTEIGCDHRMSS